MQRDPFLPEIEKFIADAGLSDSAFGKLALGDPMFVRDLKLTGRKIKPRTKVRLQTFIASERRKLGKRAA